MELIDKSIAKDLIGFGLEAGADFVDIFVERTLNNIINLKSSKIESINNGTIFGVGVRLISGDNSYYGYTNSTNRDDLLKIVQKLAVNLKSPGSSNDFSLNDLSQCKIIAAINDKNLPLDGKIKLLHSLDSKIRSQSDLIQQVNLNIVQKVQNVEVFNSEGLHVRESRPYVRMGCSAIGQDGTSQESASWSPGARGGWEFVENQDLDWIAEYLGKSVVTILNAKPCLAGKMPVVIDNGFGGVIFHEACGHLLETTAVEKKSSVFWDKMGEQIAHSAVSAVDDGTVDKLWGSISIDDEGMETQKTQLIKNGILENFLSDRLGEIKTGHKRTGSARRQSYKFPPASRMRNTYIEAGEHSTEELLSAMGDGLYCKAMGGGSVNPGTGEFNFSVREGYMVKNGKIKEAVKGATLIGTGEDIMQKISMVGNNLEFSSGMCGSVSGSVPVTVGQPAIKVDDILVGGKV